MSLVPARAAAVAPRWVGWMSAAPRGGGVSRCLVLRCALLPTLPAAAPPSPPPDLVYDTVEAEVWADCLDDPQDVDAPMDGGDDSPPPPTPPGLVPPPPPPRYPPGWVVRRLPPGKHATRRHVGFDRASDRERPYRAARDPARGSVRRPYPRSRRA